MRENFGTFAPNLSLPIHRWFRFPAGFSGEWVQKVLATHARPDLNVLDPFAGTATTLVAAQQVGVQSIGLEPHPFLSRVAKAKLYWTTDPQELGRADQHVLSETRPLRTVPIAPLLRECYPATTLAELFGFRETIRQFDSSDGTRALLWLGLMAILRKCSPVGTAQWQYILPNRRKSAVAHPKAALRDQLGRMVEDMRICQRGGAPGRAVLYAEDARGSESLPANWADLVVTSPPYPNNYDYADAVRLELTFLGEISEWGDLSSRIRPFLIRSCSQHVGSGSFEALLDSPTLAVIHDELQVAYSKLSAERDRHGGRKTYHSMVVAYFHDLAGVWRELRRACRSGSRVCFVVGDSAPYGIHLPVEQWLGELAVSLGFRDWKFEKLRDRNTKWLNRKHRIPLKEGLLWVDG